MSDTLCPDHTVSFYRPSLMVGYVLGSTCHTAQGERIVPDVRNVFEYLCTDMFHTETVTMLPSCHLVFFWWWHFANICRHESVEDVTNDSTWQQLHPPP